MKWLGLEEFPLKKNKKISLLIYTLKLMDLCQCYAMADFKY
jgi:hypothetical protein